MSQPMTVTIGEVLEAVLKDARSIAESAGMAGCYGDNGAGTMKKEVEMFKLGMNYQMSGKIPHEWEKYQQQILREKDPEYAKFLELQKKFGIQ